MMPLGRERDGMPFRLRRGGRRAAAVPFICQSGAPMKDTRTDAVRRLARGALLLALTAALQVSGRYLTSLMGPANIFIVGTLVNACLLIAVDVTGIGIASVIAFAAPVTALLTGAPIPLPFLPFIGAGNFLLVLMSYLFRRKAVGVIVGAAAKFLFLFGAVSMFLRLGGLPDVAAGILYFTFSWPQLATALLGGAVYAAARKALRIEPVTR
jgi:hypothetical protein